jgi:hypothetical protein
MVEFTTAVPSTEMHYVRKNNLGWRLRHRKELSHATPVIELGEANGRNHSSRAFDRNAQCQKKQSSLEAQAPLT